MKKLYLLVTSVLAISGLPAMAGDMMHHNSAFTGLSLGAQGDYVTVNGKQRLDTFLNGTNNISSVNTNAPGASGRLHLTYGTVVPANKMYVGVELGAGLSSVNTTDTVNANIASAAGSTDSTENLLISRTTKMKDFYTVALRVGRVFNNVLPYVKIGANWANFQTNLKGGDLNDASNSKRKLGVEAGLGVDFQVTPLVTVGAEYNHAEFRGLNTSAFDSSDTVNPTLTNTARFRSDSIGLRANFKVA